ncbi:NusG domain II-containing protein [Elusimicrobiota bacterium]
MFKLNRLDILMIVAVGLFCLVFPAVIYYMSHPGNSAVIIENNRQIKEIDLNTEDVINIQLNEENMKIEVKNGRIRVIESSCHQGICVRTGWISKTGQSIICAPNKAYIKIKGKADPEVHAVTQ